MNRLSPVAFVAALATLAACSHSQSSTVTQSTAALNSSGDIPDTQLFVTYRASRYAVPYPEGWSKTVGASSVRFVSNYDGEQVIARVSRNKPMPSTSDPSIAATLSSFSKVRDARVRSVTLPGGTAVLVAFTSESPLNAVTAKRVRLENHSYVFFRHGQTFSLDLWAPVGADNVDQWNRISQGFRWH